jgi:hypothetical protein
LADENSGRTAAPGEPRLEWTRQYERGKMARTLTNLLRASRREARKRDVPSGLRLNWVKTVCGPANLYDGDSAAERQGLTVSEDPDRLPQ